MVARWSYFPESRKRWWWMQAKSCCFWSIFKMIILCSVERERTFYYFISCTCHHLKVPSQTFQVILYRVKQILYGILIEREERRIRKIFAYPSMLWVLLPPAAAPCCQDAPLFIFSGASGFLKKTKNTCTRSSIHPLWWRERYFILLIEEVFGVRLVT